MVADGEDFNAS